MRAFWCVVASFIGCRVRLLVWHSSLLQVELRRAEDGYFAEAVTVRLIDNRVICGVEQHWFLYAFNQHRQNSPLPHIAEFDVDALGCANGQEPGATVRHLCDDSPVLAAL